jgi:probable rRNA maturation factor
VSSEKDYEIGVTLVNNAYIQDLNSKYREVDSPTDVLAFPIEVSQTKFLGDIYISLDRASEQVDENEDLETEVSRLLVHGMLHLLGHEHSPEMFARQESYLNERNQRSKIKE